MSDRTSSPAPTSSSRTTTPSSQSVTASVAETSAAPGAERPSRSDDLRTSTNPCCGEHAQRAACAPRPDDGMRLCAAAAPGVMPRSSGGSSESNVSAVRSTRPRSTAASTATRARIAPKVGHCSRGRPRGDVRRSRPDTTRCRMPCTRCYVRLGLGRLGHLEKTTGCSSRTAVRGADCPVTCPRQARLPVSFSADYKAPSAGLRVAQGDARKVVTRWRVLSIPHSLATSPWSATCRSSTKKRSSHSRHLQRSRGRSSARCAGSGPSALRRLDCTEVSAIWTAALGAHRRGQLWSGSRGVEIRPGALHPIGDLRSALDSCVRAELRAAILELRGGGSGPLRTKVFFKLRRERVLVTNLLGEGDEAHRVLAQRLDVPEAKLEGMLRRLDARDLTLDSLLLAHSSAICRYARCSRSQSGRAHRE